MEEDKKEEELEEGGRNENTLLKKETQINGD